MTLALIRSRLVLRPWLRYASTTPDNGGWTRKPLINFNAKSRGHGDSKPGQPHPCAPEEITKDFASFGKRAPPQPSKSQSSSSKGPSSSSNLPETDFDDFFQMPKRYWKRIEITDAEIDAVMSGGATYVK